MRGWSIWQVCLSSKNSVCGRQLEQLGLLRLREVTDKGIVHLEGLKKLREIRLVGTAVRKVPSPFPVRV